MRKIFLLLFISILGFSSVFAEQVVKSSFDPQRILYSSTGAVNFMTSSSTLNYLYDESGNVRAGFNRTYFTPSLRPNTKNDIIFPNGNIYTFQYPAGDSNTDNRQYFTTFFNIDDSTVVQKSNGSIDQRCQTYYSYAVNDGRFFVQRFRRWVGTSQYCSNTNYNIESSEINNTTGDFTSFTGDTPNLKTGTSISSDIYIISDNSMIYMRSDDLDTIYQFSCNDFAVCEETPFLDLDLSASMGAITEFQYFYNDSGDIPLGGLSLEIFDGTETDVYTGYFEFDENGQYVTNPDFIQGIWVTRIFSDGAGGYSTYLVNPNIMQQSSLIFNLDKNPIIAFIPTVDGYNFRYVRGGVLYDFDAVFDGYNFIGGDSSGETGIIVGGSGEAGEGGGIASALGIDCSGTFGFISPACWLDSVGAGIQNLPGYKQFTERLATYGNFFDFSLTPGDYDFTLSLPTGSNLLENEPYIFTVPATSTGVFLNTPLTESANANNVILNYLFLLVALGAYFGGIIAFLYILVFGVGIYIYKGINKVIDLLSFGILGWEDNSGGGNIISLIFVGIFFVALIALFDFIFNPVLLPISTLYTDFRELYGHIISLLYSAFTMNNGFGFIEIVNGLNVLIYITIGAGVSYKVVEKWGRLF